MTTQAETHAFQAETRELLDLMIHSLYTNKEIFLRELISNASDALDKLRFAALTETQLLPDGEELRIQLEVDKDRRILVIDDNGIGMSRDEVVANIGTIARSGTRHFLDELRRREGGDAADDAGAPPELIGQFGVGFYSSFMVADKVVLETRKAGTGEAVRWSSGGDGEYTLEPSEKAGQGTRIALHLRLADDDEPGETPDFVNPDVLRSIVKRYSDFVEYPIRLDDGSEREEGAELPTLNSMKPLWTRPRADVDDEEYHEFYRHLTHDWEEPLDVVHFKAEGTHEYTALMFVPKRRPMDLLDPTHARCRLSLYVKRVFVMEECEELLPPWLRFVRGLVDSQDLPLNVSRETLQHSRQIGQIRKRLVRKLIDALAALLKNDREKYVEFWGAFGPVLKEGLYLDDEHRDELAKICLFESSAGSELTTLAEYTDRMEAGQDVIWYATGPNRRAVEASPHLESLAAKGYEALFLTDPIDEWVTQRLTEFEGKPLKPVDRGESELGEDDAERSSREEKSKELGDLLGAVQSVLDEHVKAVRLSARLKTSPAVLVTEEGELSPQMEELLRASGQEVPKSKRVLELNPSHAVLERLRAFHQDGADSQAFKDFAELVHGQALLAEGSPPPDPARFAKLVSELMAE